MRYGIINSDLLQRWSQLSACVKAASCHLHEWHVRVDVRPSPHGPLGTFGEPWAAEMGPDLTANDRQLTIVTYTVTTKDGDTRGRHFVLVKSVNGDTLTVVDPAKPVKDHRYAMVRRDDARRGRRIVLVPPAEVSNTSVYELDSFTCAWSEGNRLLVLQIP